MKVIVGTSPTQKPQSEQDQMHSKEKSLARLDALQPGRETQGLFRRNASGPATQTIPEDLEWEKIEIEELLASATTNSLMGDTRTYRFSGVFSGSRANEFYDISKNLVESAHYFIFLEEKLLKKVTDKLSKIGAEVVVNEKKESTKVEAFNIFSITYAFALRDRKKLWLLLREAAGKEVAPEAIAGILHWKVRDMIVKGEGRPHPGIGGFSKEELVRLSASIVTLYHESHRGAGDLELLLEKFALTL